MKVINLQKDLIGLKYKKCIEISQEGLEFAVIECLSKATPTEVLVGLASTILNFNDQYCKSSEQTINILKTVIAQLEQDSIFEHGSKLN
jgi:hypothetical protein